MWRPNEPVEEGVSDLPGIDPQSKRRRSRRPAWHDGLADQTVVKTFEDVRSYRAFERTLIGSIDPRSVIELALVHRLASLLWRLRRASAIETGLFEIQGELLLARRQAPSPRTQSTEDAPNPHAGLWSYQRPRLGRTTPSGQRSRPLAALPNIAPAWRTNCGRARTASLTAKVFFHSSMHPA
jgi:hypothetical protein